MGRQINWSALEIICELLGVEDPERFLLQLIVLRDQKG